MKTINYTEFKKNTAVILDETVQHNEVVVIELSNNKNAVVLSLNDYNSLMETMYLLRSEHNRMRLSEAMTRTEKGDFILHKLIE